MLPYIYIYRFFLVKIVKTKKLCLVSLLIMKSNFDIKLVCIKNLMIKIFSPN